MAFLFFLDLGIAVLLCLAFYSPLGRRSSMEPVPVRAKFR